ncbi:antitoxin Xre/MbcA/ParS toxin-binding domain-containing protein [Sphingomonas sp. LaA6.9]|uniref:antitoxin Xre/MbcA/ParS toxin-binding domain-containing protein n=1 Tax=Sphingomonas sp. LaA6.9 TaxID=2919914 RepID=UPI001F4FE6F1|nr:antitoxin Xre/MbcA/ParS toxin-binding domain-containing protein [Sphingomonas sp. LaA6.9]MCJ8157796.1 DUF2384 domain-containing protein [Sphingomonas sp. LaA6.9]
MDIISQRSSKTPRQRTEPGHILNIDAKERPQQVRRLAFRRNAEIAKLGEDELVRQGRIVGRAMHWLGNGPDVLAFLNQHNRNLNARPIDMAIASVAGFDAVETVLSAIAPCPRKK